MVHQVARFSDAYTAWEGWNLTTFDFKRDCLNQVQKTLFSKNAQWSAVMGYHIEHATRLLGETHHLVGPTGETNEPLYSGTGCDPYHSGGYSRRRSESCTVSAYLCFSSG